MNDEDRVRNLQASYGYYVDRKMWDDVVDLFAPIGKGVNSCNFLTSRLNLPANNVTEFIAWGKNHPEVSYASPGVGSPPHLAMELLKTMSGTTIQHVPYKNSPQAVVDVMGGQVNAMLTDLPPGAVQVKDLSSPLFTGVYYNTTFAGGFGTITLWPVPSDPFIQMTVWYSRQIMDVGSLSGELEIPQRWYLAIQSLLAHQMALELPGVATDRISYLEGQAEKYLTLAENEERDKSPIYLTPGIQVYTR